MEKSASQHAPVYQGQCYRELRLQSRDVSLFLRKLSQKCSIQSSRPPQEKDLCPGIA